MNSALALDPYATSGSCHFAPEKVGLRRIRLTMPCLCLSASVGTFFAAEKVLLGWAVRHRGPIECGFEIIYDDGHTLAGDYRFRGGATGRPALMAYVRKTLAALCDGTGRGTPVRGLVDGAHSFLAHYETEDFISN